MLFLYILLGLFCFIILFLLIAAFTQVKIEISYKRESEDDRGEIKINAFGGLFKYRIEIPSVKLKPQELDISTKAEGKGIATNLEDVDVTPSTLQRFRENYEFHREKIPHFHRTINRFLSKVTCEELTWRTKFGTGEAAETGVLTGIAWGIKTGLLGIAYRYINWTRKPLVEVDPQFSQTVFHMHFHSIIRFRLGYAMLSFKRIWLHVHF